MNDFMAQLEREFVVRGEDRGPPAGRDDLRRRDPEPSVAEIVDVVERRAKPWMKIAAGVGMVASVLATWGVLNNPLETKAEAAEAHAKILSDIEGVKTHDAKQDADIAALRSTMSDVSTDVKEGKELQLMDRLAQVRDRKQRATPGTELYSDYLGQEAELQQRLQKVRRELGR